MEFTYDSYRSLLSLLAEHGCQTADYHNWQQKQRCVILRHDIDCSIEAALEFAELEQECGVTSTYFVLVSTDFYNIFSKKSHNLLEKIQALGHEIGLHLDETVYPKCAHDSSCIQEKILQEVALLQTVTGRPVTTVSMHRPSKAVLDADLKIPGMVNSYSDLFFRQFKYLSDSRRHWREPVREIIKSEQYERLHLLTHAFWYHSAEQTLQESVSNFIASGNLKLYQSMKENITDLESICSNKVLGKGKSLS